MKGQGNRKQVTGAERPLSKGGWGDVKKAQGSGIEVKGSR